MSVAAPLLCVVGAPPAGLAEAREHGTNRSPTDPQLDTATSADGTGAEEPSTALASLRRQNTTRIRELIPLRYGRMLESPFAFFRGEFRDAVVDFAVDRADRNSRDCAALKKACRAGEIAADTAA